MVRVLSLVSTHVRSAPHVPLAAVVVCAEAPMPSSTPAASIIVVFLHVCFIVVID
jgi:hypothetical protein